MSGTGYLAASIPLRLATSGSVVALPILAVQELGNVAIGGALVAASLAPSVLSAPVVGVALDRARRPRRLVLAAALVTAAAFVLAAGAGTVPVPVVVAALVAAGAAAPFLMGGMSSFVADEIDDERRAYAFDALSYNVGSVAGPAVVAVAVAVGSARIAMLAMAVVAALGAAATFATRLAARPVQSTGAWRSIVVGTRHLVRHRPLAVVTLAGTVSQFGGGALPVVAVVVALQRAGTADLGAWIVTAFSIAGLVGALVSAARRWTSLPPVAVMGGGFALVGVLTIAAAPDLGLAWTIALVGASGLFTASSSAAMLLLRKQQSPRSVRSQVFTVGAGLRATSAAVGAGVVGALADVDAGVLLALVGGVWVLSALVLLAYPRHAPPVADEPPAAGVSATRGAS